MPAWVITPEIGSRMAFLDAAHAVQDLQCMTLKRIGWCVSFSRQRMQQPAGAQGHYSLCRGALDA